MSLNYAIFRSEPIYTLKDLAQIGSHNKREKKAYNSNPDIKIENTKDNIELVPLEPKYVKGFYEKTLEYRKEWKNCSPARQGRGLQNIRRRHGW